VPFASRAVLLPLALVTALAQGCAGSPPQRPANDPTRPAAEEIPPPRTMDRLGELAFKVLAEPCSQATMDPPLPSLPSGRGAAAAGGGGTGAGSSYDVVVYTAHPDDEAMYSGGTLGRLVKAGRRVSLAVMSHGEGGRLLEPGPRGTFVERRDLPREKVVEVRDDEIRRATGRVPVEFRQLYPAAANVDFGWTTSCEEALRLWNAKVPGGVTEMLKKLIDDLRTRRPRIVITFDPRNDPEGSNHGHHKAVGVLVELAARAAGDSTVPGGKPHVVEEVLAFAPKDQPGDISLATGNEVRLAMLREYRSQMKPADLKTPLAERFEEHFVVRWRPAGISAPSEGSILAAIAGPAPSPPPARGKRRGKRRASK
jgi:LmbE family N-acetylglucosaminyl deacetylase